MAVRVIIERKVKEGQQIEMMKILRELRSLALYRKGYISGETLRSVDDPSMYIVISNWERAEDWEAWQNHPERDQVMKKLEKCLVSPETSNVFLFVYF